MHLLDAGLPLDGVVYLDAEDTKSERSEIRTGLRPRCPL